MIKLLEPFDNFCISKMMLKSFPSMIEMSTPIIKQFFESALYKPLLMQYSLNVKWTLDRDEFVFASDTSLITHEFLQKKLSKKPIKKKHENQEEYEETRA